MGEGELQQREHEIEFERGRIDRQPRLRPVAGEEFGLAGEAADQRRAAAILRQEGPAEILDGIAEMHELPVENGGNAPVALEEIAEPVIAVNQRHPLGFRRMAAQPGERAMRHRMRAQRPAAKARLPVFDLQLRGVLRRDGAPPGGERRRAPVEAVQRGERVDEIGREAVAARAFEALSRRTPGQRRVPSTFSHRKKGAPRIAGSSLAK